MSDTMSDTTKMIVLHPEEAAWLKVLLDNASPRESGGPMDWEGAGRRAAEAMLGFRPKCTCTGIHAIEGNGFGAGCRVHDLSTP